MLQVSKEDTIKPIVYDRLFASDMDVSTLGTNARDERWRRP